MAATLDRPPRPRRPPGLLNPEDLEDRDRFERIEDVPLLDAHDHPTKGLVDEALLYLLAANSNRRANGGNPALVTIGHTDDVGPELGQPPIVGYARTFTVAEHRGTPCLMADLYIRREHLGLAGQFPHRSVERFRSDDEPRLNFIDAVALLKRTPERDLGILETYRRRPAAASALVRDGRDPRVATAAEMRAAVRLATREGLDFPGALARVREESAARVRDGAGRPPRALVAEDVPALVRYAEREGISDGRLAVARYARARAAGEPTSAPAAPAPLASAAEVAEFVRFCAARGLTDPVAARASWRRERAGRGGR